MQNFKRFYIVVTGNMRWGKSSDSLQKAYKIALVKNPLKEHHVVYTGIVNDTATEEQVSNLCSCYNVGAMGSVRFYDNPSKVDSAMVKKYFVGWITEEMGKPADKK